MSDIKRVIVINAGPIKSDAGVHGSDIGRVWISTPPVEFDVDYALKHDNWVPIVGPLPFGPTWLKTGEQGWVKKTWVAVKSEDVMKFILTIDPDGESSIIRIA